jgi:hypothetical protein
LTAIKGYNKEALKQGGKEIDVNAVSKYVYPIIEGIENTVGLNKSVPSRDNVTVNTPKYSTDKNIKQQVSQSNVESQNQGIANEFKSTIDINLNVNPADMKSLVMDYLKSEAIGKELVNIYKNRFNENNALIGNTSSAKNNIR